MTPMPCWPLANSMATAAMFSQLSDKFIKFVCGTTTPDDDALRYFLPSSPSVETQPRLSSSSSPPITTRTKAPEDDDEHNNVMAAPHAEADTDHNGEEETSATLPCLAFASEHGYKVFSLADRRMIDVRPMPPVVGRRLVSSPYGGMVLATDVCYRHPCHLADPFTGSRAPLPDLPIPFSERQPLDCPHDKAGVRVTDDGLAWDWSPRGVLVARGDTAFFFEHSGSGGEWAPVHRSRLGSPMTVNYRAGLFFVFELHTLETTVIDAGTLRARARIPAPRGLGAVDAAYLAPSADDAILLVHRAGDAGVAFTEAYHAWHRLGSRRPPRWARARDIGDRAVFVDGAHAFTVAAGPSGARANRVYVILARGVARPCGRLAVAYDVGFSDLTRPEFMGRMKLDAGQVERMWGQPHWIIPRSGSDRESGHREDRLTGF